MAAQPRRPTFPARVRLGPAARPANTTVGRGTARRAPASSDPVPARTRMVARLRRQGVEDERVLAAMGLVDRHLFVDSTLADRAYEETALPIGLDQTISSPGIVARMVELLLQGGVRGAAGRLGRVLDVGTGCGYQAMVLAQVATEVYSIERLRGLHEKARANLRQFRVPNIHLILGDGMEGFPSGAPYAGIVAAAGGRQIPEAWTDQLAEGGRIVAPVDDGAGGQTLVVIDKGSDGLRRSVLEAVRFVPLKSGVA